MEIDPSRNLAQYPMNTSPSGETQSAYHFPSSNPIRFALAESTDVATSASVFERVAGHAGTLVQHGDSRVSSGFKEGQRLMAAGKLAMAPHAEIGHVTGGA